ETMHLLQSKMKTFVEDIFGLLSEKAGEADKLKGVMAVLIELRKEARAKRDWATSDKIRNQLAEVGIQLKDEKDGGMSWTI
ncbi:MAG TPA: cysteine--tRNA ligase, partial [Flavisolibacter sp.]|nr:cysteine--tRNA ligase [Flavisolibacter sp.]